jgi:hypothetical protein
MKQAIYFVVLLYFSIFLACPDLAQDPFIYPAQGRSL